MTRKRAEAGSPQTPRVPVPYRRPPIIIETVAYALTDMTVKMPEGTGGSCIPHSYILASAAKIAGVAARIVECEFRLRAKGDARPCMSYRNERTGFLGHTLVYLPTKHFLIDTSLHTQESQVIPLAMPSGGPVFVDFDHNRHKSARVKLERGHIEYANFRYSGNKWQDANMPWEGYAEIAKVIYEEGLKAHL